MIGEGQTNQSKAFFVVVSSLSVVSPSLRTGCQGGHERVCPGPLSHPHDDAAGLQLAGKERGGSLDVWTTGGEYGVSGGTTKQDLKALVRVSSIIHSITSVAYLQC